MFTLSNDFYYLPTVAANNRASSLHVHSPENLAATSANFMDSVFFSEGDWSAFLHMMQVFGSTYICLWSYESSTLSQTFNCLQYKDGFYRERSDQPSSSSSGSLAQVRFNEYKQSLFIVDHGRHVPGYAFVNSFPYLKLESDNLLCWARTEAQRQFYQAAGIKTAVFMGCNAGEIELGFSDQSQVNIEMEMMKWFPDDFSRQLPNRELPQPTDQNRPASSSSSLRSLSYDSPEYPPFLIDVSSTRYMSENPQESNIVEQALRPSPSLFTASTTSSPQQQVLQALSQIRCPQIPSIEGEDAAMANAMFAVICTSPSSASSSFQPQQNLPPNYPVTGNHGAFKWYRSSALAPTVPISARFRRQNMLKRSIAFLKSLNTMRAQEQQVTRTSSTQLHHMISERRRREKLNESFQALRLLLPPGTKKDKASVLTSTTDYLSSLKAQVTELSRRNAILEAQVLPKKAAAAEGSGSSNDQRLEVRIKQVSESTSAARLMDLQVTRIGEISITDLVVTLIEFLKRDQNVSLMSIEANTTMEESSTSVNHIVLRLKIEGEWDESAFQEAVRRVCE